MKKLIFLIPAMNIFCLSLFSDNIETSQIEKINSEINIIQNEIHEEELKAMEAEVNSEKYIKYEWDKYVGEIQKAEKSDQKIEELEEELKKLKAERALMIKNKTPDESKP